MTGLLLSRSRLYFKVLNYDFGPECKEIHLVPISDTHIGTPDFCKKELIDILNLCREMGYYIVLVGDILNLDTKNSVGNVYESLMSPQEALNTAVDIFLPYKDLIAGVVAGNHEMRISKEVGLDITKAFTDILGISDRYSEIGLYLHLQLGKDRHNRRYNYIVYVTHGWGAGRKIGSKVNKGSELIEMTNANCYIIGHDHLRDFHSSLFYFYDIRTKDIVEMNQVVVHSGSFVKTAKYVSRLGQRGSSVGLSLITFSGKRKSIKVTMVVNDD